MAKKVFGIFNIPKKTGPTTSTNSTNSMEDDESVDDPSPILPSLPDLKEHLQNLQLVSKRKRTEPEFLKNFVVTTKTAAEHEDSNNETNLIDYWKVHAYYPIIDEVVNNLKTRFSAESLNLAISIDHFFNLDYEKSSFFIQQYKDLLKVDLNSLQAEMMVAKNCIQNYNNKTELGPEQKNQINLFKKNITISTFPNVYKLLNLALTLPISSASCERSFSTMRRINTYIRSTMTQDRFSSLAILNIERDISNNIDSNDILNIYSKTNRRLEL
ncbi:uncharacterized protein LOC111030535 isoform X2 [Myzus persicae]|uniref:uncharacterized protein LOC111030535 isoform X2 n=1 Tax=Myzus persicae TaxID=13164 RepID=UPI000B938113|nr:uncharacterized protein LOC111030535 isoform X2 [Myzus persicae]